MVSNGNRLSEHFPPGTNTAPQTPNLADVSRMGSEWLQTARSFVAERPVACLAGAFATGVVIAWFLKRSR
jgi:hypothetical protein